MSRPVYETRPASLDEVIALARNYWQWGSDPFSQVLFTILVHEIEKRDE